ncbi:zar1-like protein [Limosa lapponica baueri]|uniref:Zar1-like protein n=1 Tax=Limosa lapponica baueri TaxID=1758121 RepID=A0A2I0TT03_LIMLA|nr:zar1-like protein [Limosa lapponica baueri]
MEGFVYSPFGTYQSFRGGLTPSRSRDPAVKQPSWKQSKSGGISPFLGGPLSPLPSDYLDGYRRAQLQALLSQLSPGLAPGLRRADTKEAGVQVNLRAEAAVQCSLGPRTLPVGRPLSPAAVRAHGHLALYSPAPDHRRLLALPEAATPREKEEAPETTPQEQRAVDGGGEQQEGRAEAAPTGEATAETPGEGAAAAPRRRAAFQVWGLRRGAGSWCSPWCAKRGEAGW